MECGQESRPRSVPEAFKLRAQAGEGPGWARAGWPPLRGLMGLSVDSSFEYSYDLSLNWKQTEALPGWVTALGALPGTRRSL